MKMGVASFFPLLFLLMSVASARDVFMPIAKNAERNHLLMDDGIDLHGPAKGLENGVSSFEGSSTEFSNTCLEISRKAKEVIDDQSLINKIDTLASTFCHILSSDLEAKLRSNETCATCRTILEIMRDELRDTDKELRIIVYLLKACEMQKTITDQVALVQCKKLVFAFGPMVITALQQIVNMDICLTVRMCADPQSRH